MRRNTITKSVRLSSDQQMLAALPDLLGKGFVIVGGKQLTAADIEGVLGNRVAATTSVETKKGEYKAAVEAERETLAKTDDLLAQIRQALLVMFSASPSALASLGLAPRKAKRQLTLDERVAVAAKAKATRQARGTLGPKQRSRLHDTAAPPPAHAPAEPPVVNATNNAPKG
jgi:hypothetical protein